MKLTVNVDEALLKDAMTVTAARNEDELVQAALQHLSSYVWVKNYLKDGPPPTPEELGNAYSPDYDPDAGYASRAPAIQHA